MPLQNRGECYADKSRFICGSYFTEAFLRSHLAAATAKATNGPYSTALFVQSVTLQALR